MEIFKTSSEIVCDNSFDDVAEVPLTSFTAPAPDADAGADGLDPPERVPPGEWACPECR